MTELGTRSGSQILRTFLPQQTADLKGGIYKVTEWSSAIPISVDQDIISVRLLREITPWTRAKTDNGFAADLRRGVNVEVVELDDRRGVAVERFPEVWLCQSLPQDWKRAFKELSLRSHDGGANSTSWDFTLAEHLLNPG